MTAGIPVNAAALIRRRSKSRKGIKILIVSRVFVMPDSCTKHLPKMPELRHVVFCAAHQLSEDLDNSGLLKCTICVFFVHQLPEKVLHQRGISLRSVREPHIEAQNRAPH